MLTLIGSLINETSEAFWGMRELTKEGRRAMTLRSLLRKLQSASISLIAFPTKASGSSGEILH